MTAQTLHSLHIKPEYEKSILAMKNYRLQLQATMAKNQITAFHASLLFPFYNHALTCTYTHCWQLIACYHPVKMWFITWAAQQMNRWGLGWWQYQGSRTGQGTEQSHCSHVGAWSNLNANFGRHSTLDVHLFHVIKKNCAFFTWKWSSEWKKWKIMDTIQIQGASGLGRLVLIEKDEDGR